MSSNESNAPVDADRPSSTALAGQQSRDEARPSRLARQGQSLCRAFAFGLCFSSALTLLAKHHWIAELLANLRIQQVIGIAFLLLLSMVTRRWRVSVIALALFAIHLPWFLAAFPASREKLTDDTSSRSGEVVVAVVNVLTQNPRHDLVLQELVRCDADVFAVLELSTELSIYLESAVGDRYPHSMLRPKDTSNFGIGLFSKFPLRDEGLFSTHEGIDSICATVTVNGNSYRVFATHPLPPMNAGLFQHRNRQLQDVAERVVAYRDRANHGSTVVVGDLNLTPWSPWFADFQDQSGLVRAIDRVSIQPTWYRYNSFPFGLVIDHCLCDPSLECRGYEIGSDIGSDHRSITVRLTPRESASARTK